MAYAFNTLNRPSADSAAELMQDLMKANLSSAVLAGYFSRKNPTASSGFLSAEEAVEYAEHLQRLAVCEKEMAFLCGQLNEIQGAFSLRAAIASSYHTITQVLREAFKKGIGFKMGLYELDRITQSNLDNLAQAKKNLDTQKISRAIEASAKPLARPLTGDKALASKLNL